MHVEHNNHQLEGNNAVLLLFMHAMYLSLVPRLPYLFNACNGKIREPGDEAKISNFVAYLYDVDQSYCQGHTSLAWPASQEKEVSSNMWYRVNYVWCLTIPLILSC